MKKSYNKFVILTVVASCVLLFSMIPIRKNVSEFHSVAEYNFYKTHTIVAPPIDSSIIFPTAGNCDGCHGYDPQMNGMVDSYGNDVNVNDVDVNINDVIVMPMAQPRAGFVHRK